LGQLSTSSATPSPSASLIDELSTLSPEPDDAAVVPPDSKLESSPLVSGVLALSLPLPPVDGVDPSLLSAVPVDSTECLVSSPLVVLLESGALVVPLPLLKTEV
jgi:hypothetical protein